jgi:hypothetical protein
MCYDDIAESLRYLRHLWFLSRHRFDQHPQSRVNWLVSGLNCLLDLAKRGEFLTVGCRFHFTSAPEFLGNLPTRAAGL